MGIVVVIIILLILLLLKPVINFAHSLWKLAFELCSSPGDLRKKYGEWAVVTGSTDGIGKEYAKELAKKDLNLVLVSRTLEKLNRTKDEIQKINSTIQIKVIQADFSKGKDEIKKIEAELINIPVGILVNNVGKLTEYPMYFEEIPEDELWNQIIINIGATTAMTHMVIKQMRERGKGAIVNLSSASDMAPLPLFSVYSSSKAFIKCFSEALREEYAKDGLMIQCLSPFYIKTKMIEYSNQLQTSRLCPDAAEYARSSVQVLGKLNSSTGYWGHEIPAYFWSLVPVWFRIKVGFYINTYHRNEYFKLQKKNNVN